MWLWLNVVVEEESMNTRLISIALVAIAIATSGCFQSAAQRRALEREAVWTRAPGAPITMQDDEGVLVVQEESGIWQYRVDGNEVVGRTCMANCRVVLKPKRIDNDPK